MPRKKRQPKPLEDLPQKQIREVMRALASRGGKVKGISKARTSEQARAAVNVRWEKERAKKAGIDTPPSGECPPTP